VSWDGGNVVAEFGKYFEKIIRKVLKGFKRKYEEEESK
jgi:hypothetical protein